VVVVMMKHKYMTVYDWFGLFSFVRSETVGESNGKHLKTKTR